MQLHPVPQNLLLRALSRGKAASTAGKLRHLTFEAGQGLWSAGAEDPCAVFPVRGVLSLQLSAGAGKDVEIAMVGREGFAGVALIPGAEWTRTAAVAISAGEALVMPGDIFRRAVAVPAFRAGIERYIQMFISMLSQLLVCNRVHVIEKVCVGRLLQIHDRIHGDSFRLTQDVFARQLGVRRASISRAVTGLQKRGAIEYDGRGSLTIRDRSQLEQIACSCYRQVKSEFDRHVDQHGGL
jgi:CRP-like cAMP-binding protein